MARILELKSVKNLKLTIRVHLVQRRKIVWRPFSPKWCVSWSYDQLYVCILLPYEMRRVVWVKCTELCKERAAFATGYVCTYDSDASGLWILALCPLWGINTGGCVQGWRSAYVQRFSLYCFEVNSRSEKKKTSRKRSSDLWTRTAITAFAMKWII
jgi:hypothetical protein